MCFLNRLIDHGDATIVWAFAILSTCRSMRDIIMMLLVPRRDRRYVLHSSYSFKNRKLKNLRQ